jgi:hypothetical protein
MITGIGRSFMIFSRNSRPFMSGISISSVITSGLSCLMAAAGLHGIASFTHNIDTGIASKHGLDQATHRWGIINNKYTCFWGHERPVPPLMAIGGDVCILETVLALSRQTFGMANVEMAARRQKIRVADPDPSPGWVHRNR